MKNKKVYFPIALAVLFTLFTAPVLVFAQTDSGDSVRFYIHLDQLQVAPDSEIIARILVDTAHPINAFDMTITYPKDLIQPIAFNDSGSLVDIWQERQWNSNSGVMKFSGGFLRPFSGAKGLIAQVRLKALAAGVATISLNAPSAYYADGTGSKASITIDAPVAVTIKDDSSIFYTPPVDDIVPPMFESLEHLKNSATGTYLVIFLAKDSGSGLKKVSIRSMQWLMFNSWQVVQNPAELPPGTWKYQIAAVDNIGNESVKTQYVVGGIVKKVLGLAVAIFLVAIFYAIITKWMLPKKLF